MNVPAIHVKMEDLVLMMSMPTLVLVILATLGTIVKQVSVVEPKFFDMSHWSGIYGVPIIESTNELS